MPIYFPTKGSKLLGFSGSDIKERKDLPRLTELYIPYKAAIILGYENDQYVLGEETGPVIEICQQILSSSQDNEIKFERFKQGNLLERLHHQIQVAKSNRSTFFIVRLFYKFADFLGSTLVVKAEKLLQQSISFVATEALTQKKPFGALLRHIKAEYLQNNASLAQKLQEPRWHELLIEKKIKVEDFDKLDVDKMNQTLRFWGEYAPEELTRFRYHFQGLSLNLVDYLTFFRDTVNFSCLAEMFKTLPKAVLNRLFNGCLKSQPNENFMNIIKEKLKQEDFQEVCYQTCLSDFLLILNNKEVHIEQFKMLDDLQMGFILTAMAMEAPEELVTLRIMEKGYKLDLFCYLAFFRENLESLSFFIDMVDGLPIEIKRKFFQRDKSDIDILTEEDDKIARQRLEQKEFQELSAKLTDSYFQFLLETDGFTPQLFREMDGDNVEMDENDVNAFMYFLTNNAPEKLSELRFLEDGKSLNLLQYFKANSKDNNAQYLMELMPSLPKEVSDVLLAHEIPA